MKLKAALTTLFLSKVDLEPIPWTALFTDLPAEVLIAILERLDPGSLHCLALTCRYLHVVSLPVLYNQYLQPDISKRIIINGVTYPVLPALRLALFMRHVEDFHWTLDFRRRRTFSELSQLSRIISHITSVGSIRIDFGPGKKILGRRVREKTITEWKIRIIQLLEIAASKTGSIFVRDNLNTAKQNPKLCGLVPKFWIPYPEPGGSTLKPTALLRSIPRVTTSVRKLQGVLEVSSIADVTSPHSIAEKASKDRAPPDVNVEVLNSTVRVAHSNDSCAPSSSVTWFNSLYTGCSTSSPRPYSTSMREGPTFSTSQQASLDDAPEYEFVDSDTPLEAEYELVDSDPLKPHLNDGHISDAVIPQVVAPPKYIVSHLTLDSLSLIQEPFLHWTLDFMNRTSLTTLDVCTRQPVVEFLEKIHVPTLEEFTFSCGVVSFDEIVEFLKRHSALEVVRFRNTHIYLKASTSPQKHELPATEQPASPSAGERSSSPIDPEAGVRIQHLEASCKIFNHLCEVGFIFPKLLSLTLELGNFTGDQSHYDAELTSALSACKTEYLCFSFPTQQVGAGHLLAWFGSTVHNRSTLRQIQNLSSVKYLSVYAGALSSPQLFQRTEKWIKFWCLWFTKIPNLEMVNFQHVFCDYKADVTERYFNAMRERTPELSFGSNGQMVHHGSRMTAQTWDEFIRRTSGIMFPTDGIHFRRRNATAVADDTSSAET